MEHARPNIPQCPHCSKSFKKVMYLNVHLITHDKNALVNCKVCRKIIFSIQTQNKYRVQITLLEMLSNKDDDTTMVCFIFLIEPFSISCAYNNGSNF